MEKIKVTTLFDDSLEEAIEKQYQLLINDPHVKKEIERLALTMAEVKENIATLTAFYEEHHYCAHCPDLDACDKYKKHYQIKLEKVGRFLERTYQPCPLLLKKIELSQRYLYHDFPEGKSWDDIDLLNLDKQGRQSFFDIAIKIIKNETNNWVYTTGSRKSGKTFVNIALINSLFKIGLNKAAVIDCSKRFKQLVDLSINDKNEFNKQFDMLSNVSVLLLDGFGNEYKSDFVRDQIVFPLILARSNHNLLTLFTSDFSFKDIETLYATSNPGKIRARQLVDLLKSHCHKEISLATLTNLY